MFLKNWMQMGGFDLNHHWHGIDILMVFECMLLATIVCLFLSIFGKFSKRSRLTILSLIGAASFATAAWAANTALSALSASGAIAGPNLFYVVQTVGVGGVKATATQVATFINSLFSGDFTVTSGGVATLKNTGPGATGPIGSTTVIPQVTIDAQGRVTALGSATAAGTVSSIATSCGVSGGTITTTGTLTTSLTPNPQTGSNYAIVTGDCGKVVNLSNGSNQIPTIAQAGSTGFLTGWYTEVCNQGAGTQTITPATSTIGGAATYVLAAGTAAAPKCVGIVSDGTNYQLDLTGPGGGGTPGGSSGQIQYNNSGAFGGFTQSGNCTTVTSTGVISCDYPISGYVASSWYLPQTGAGGSGATGTPMTASTIYCVYGAVAQKVTIGALGLGLSTAASGGLVQAAIYTNVSSRPGTLLSSIASQSTTTTNTLTASLAANKQVGPGGSDAGRDIWWCFNNDATAAATAKYHGNINTGAIGQATLIGSPTAANLLNKFLATSLGVQCAGAACNGGSSTFGSWPANLNGSTWTDTTGNVAPLPLFQAASVP